MVKLSDEDAAWLWPDRTPFEVLHRLADSGPRLVVMTCGEQGCMALLDGERHERPARPAALVDTIGAGDAFMSGLLAGIFREGADRALPEGRAISVERMDAMLRTALVSASIVVSRSGADPPDRHELESALAVYADDGMRTD